MNTFSEDDDFIIEPVITSSFNILQTQCLETVRSVLTQFVAPAVVFSQVEVSMSATREAEKFGTKEKDVLIEAFFFIAGQPIRLGAGPDDPYQPKVSAKLLMRSQTHDGYAQKWNVGTIHLRLQNVCLINGSRTLNILCGEADWFTQLFNTHRPLGFTSMPGNEDKTLWIINPKQRRRGRVSADAS